MDRVLCVVGPTASGKTAVAAALAQELSGEVVSADSMQLYRGMDIGTAKPDEAERGGVPHHMLDVAEPWEEYSAARYAAEAGACVRDILARGKLPIVAGGTGLYVNALLGRVSFEEEQTDPAVRARLEAEAAASGAEALHARLAAADPDYARTVHPNNVRRVIRALEIIETQGITVTERLARAKARPAAFDAVTIGLCPEPRELIWERTDRRVGEMLARGLEDEARRLSALPLSQTARQAIGYKELFAYFDGKATLSEAADAIRLHTRQYAKRQLTWFRADPSVHWILYDRNVKFSLILQEARDICQSYGIMRTGDAPQGVS